MLAFTKGRQHSEVAECKGPCGVYRQVCETDKSVFEGRRQLTEISTVLVGNLYENLEVIDTDESGFRKVYFL